MSDCKGELTAVYAKTSVDRQLKARLKNAEETGSREQVELLRFCTTFPGSAIMMAEKVDRPPAHLNGAVEGISGSEGGNTYIHNYDTEESCIFYTYSV